jgi:hypothetical protein
MQQIKPSHYSADEGDGLDPLHSLQYNQKQFICGWASQKYNHTVYKLRTDKKYFHT